MNMAADRDDTLPQLVKKPQSNSIVWDYFGLRTTENGAVLTSETDKPICRTCFRSVPAKGGNTSNLMNHLKEHHAELYSQALTAQKRILRTKIPVQVSHRLISQQLLRRSMPLRSLMPSHHER